MTHCVDFFKKWKKEPNFCGIGKASCKGIEQYLEFADDFASEHGIDVSIVYRNVPQSAVKPILKFKRDSDIRKKASKSIAQTLKDKHAITGKYVNSIIGIDATPRKVIQTLPAVSATQSTDSHSDGSIKDKIRLINNALTTGQLNVLHKVMSIYELNNEYEAIGLIIKWASERVEK